MDRYKKALSEQDFKRYKNMNLHSKLVLLHNGVDSTAIKILCLNDLEQALTPPTEEEVCKALSKYLDEKVWYENGCFYIGTPNEYEAVVYLFDDDVHFNVVLSPKIIILIGRFYEGVMENE
ncbi:MAG: hypothetical protein M0Q88_00225 [Bacilli bacterium]|nr:hypothetical protein [Bacilli bacterium]